MQEDVEIKFYKNFSIQKETNCWIWIGVLNNGKPTLYVKDKQYNPKRLSLSEADKTDIPSITNILSYCNNSLCVNPEHLYWKAEDRFWIKVHKTDNCWLWKGNTDNKYGTFSYRENGEWIHTKAHRYSYQLAFGIIPDNMLVCHHCDNPPCVNPAHLFLGTHKDNAYDRDCKGRGATSKLTADQVMQIRKESNLAELAQKYNISEITIADIIIGKSWKHIK